MMTKCPKRALLAVFILVAVSLFPFWKTADAEPTADFTWAADAADPYTFHFDASASVCPAGHTCSYAWDFDDGSPLGSGVTTSHTYTGSGIWLVELTVTDQTPDPDEQSTVSRFVTVDAEEVAPTAGFTATNDTTVDYLVNFNASASVCPAGDTCEYTWDFGDGSVIFRDADATTSHSYATALPPYLTRPVTLTVNDTTSGVSSLPITQYVTPKAKLKPAANFNWAPDKTTNYMINFDAAISGCPTGGTCTYVWDFDDGSPLGSGVTTSHAYSSNTQINVILTVTYTNSGGYITTDTITQAVTPKRAWLPAIPSITNLSVSGYQVTFDDATTGGTNPVLVTAYWGDGTSTPAQEPLSIFTHTYAEPGTYFIRVKAVTGTGIIKWTAPVQVTVPLKVNISGQVTTKTGIPLAGVSIRLKNSAGKVIKMTSSASNGTFILKNVNSSADYTIQAVKFGYTFAPIPVTVDVDNVVLSSPIMAN